VDMSQVCSKASLIGANPNNTQTPLPAFALLGVSAVKSRILPVTILTDPDRRRRE
jgi:hypothetical protein